MIGARLIRAAKVATRELAPGLVAASRRVRCKSSHARVQRILDKSAGPDTSEPEAVFGELQRSFKPPPEYGYDPFSTWRRGTTRATALMETMKRCPPGLDVLEAACGDGMTGFLLAQYGHRVVLADMEDWRDTRTRSLPLLVGPLEKGLPSENNSFDLVYSYNAFEHFRDPSAVIQELVRVCRPGGIIYLDFNPLYTSPWGLHAYRTFSMPYPQYLFSEQFIEAKLRELGICDLGRDLNGLQPLNRWTWRQFEDLWKQSGCEIINLQYNRSEEHLHVVLRFPRAFSGRGLMLDDLVTHGVLVVLRKPSHD